jgi:hypothetical protein
LYDSQEKSLALKTEMQMLTKRMEEATIAHKNKEMELEQFKEESKRVKSTYVGVIAALAVFLVASTGAIVYLKRRAKPTVVLVTSAPAGRQSPSAMLGPNGNAQVVLGRTVPTTSPSDPVSSTKATPADGVVAGTIAPRGSY